MPAENFEPLVAVETTEEATPDLSFVLALNAYDSDNRLARERRVHARELLPSEMDVEVVKDLGQKVYRLAHGAVKDELPIQDAHRAGRRAEAKFLRWLADSGTKDIETAHSARQVLRHNHGLSGWVSAVWISTRETWSH